MNSGQTQIAIALISAIGGILAAYIAVRYKDRVTAKNRPKDRMESIFDGYESLIKQQQLDIDRKESQLVRTQEIIDRLQVELNTTREIVDKQQRELVDSRKVNEDLVIQLSQMKKTYMTSKIDEQRSTP